MLLSCGERRDEHKLSTSTREYERNSQKNLAKKSPKIEEERELLRSPKVSLYIPLGFQNK